MELGKFRQGPLSPKRPADGAVGGGAPVGLEREPNRFTRWLGCGLQGKAVNQCHLLEVTQRFLPMAWTRSRVTPRFAAHRLERFG